MIRSESLVDEQAHYSKMEVVREAHEAIIYRDDGIAQVASDGRPATSGVFTTDLTPGPPVLGPYGNRRENWLPIPDEVLGLHVIGVVKARAASGWHCTLAQREAVNDHLSDHLIITSPNPDQAALTDLWVETQSSEIWRVGLRTAPRDWPIALVNMRLDVSTVDGFPIIAHAGWSNAESSGDYTFSNFSFPASVPSFILDSPLPAAI